MVANADDVRDEPDLARGRYRQLKPVFAPSLASLRLIEWPRAGQGRRVVIGDIDHPAEPTYNDAA